MHEDKKKSVRLNQKNETTLRLSKDYKSDNLK